MSITIAALIAAGIGPTQARIFAEPLSAACERFQINTRPRIAAFVAETRHESQGFTRLEENLFYSSADRIRAVWPSRFRSALEAAPYARNPQKLANRVYANRLGNGDEDSGDGWRYRGSGLIHLTGRANFMAAGDGLGMDLKGHPEVVRQPVVACLTAAWYWFTNKLNALADASLIDQITEKVNGPAMLGQGERRNYFEEALAAFA